MLENKILRIARRLQAIAQTGLHFTSNEFDRDRYEELRELSVQLASEVSDSAISKIRDLFTSDTGFQTPKVDIRSVVLKEGKILLTRERSDGRYSIPGGFAEINYSPFEIAVKEVLEETGLIVKANRVLAIVDTNRHDFPPLEFHYYKIAILCDLLGGNLCDSDETTDSGFFDFDNLPELSEKRNTRKFISLIERLTNSNLSYSD